MISLPPSLIALRISGDLDGLTYYTTKRGRTVAYPAAPARKPPSPAQTVCRDRWSKAAQDWHALTVDERATYERASLALSLCMTGYNLWIHLCLRGSQPEWQALCLSSGEKLKPFPRPT
jgi:hypothetical protein